jgi:hypothetical protein
MILSCMRILGEPWQRPSGDCVRRRKRCWRHCRGVPVLVGVDRTYEQRLTRCCIRIWLVQKLLAVFSEDNYLQPLALVVIVLFDKVELRVVRILTKFDVYDSLLFSLLLHLQQWWHALTVGFNWELCYEKCYVAWVKRRESRDSVLDLSWRQWTKAFMISDKYQRPLVVCQSVTSLLVT